MLRLAEAIVHQAKKYEPEKIAFQITRLRDNCVAFQFVSDEKAERNILFAQGKRNACIHEGHSSFHAFVRGHVEGNADALFTRGLEEIPAAVKLAMMSIIKVDGAVGVDAQADAPLVASFSTDGYSESYGSAADRTATLEKQLNEEIRRLLYGVKDDNGVPLLYRGI